MITPFLIAPFDGVYPTSGVFDHNPRGTTGEQLSFLGEPFPGKAGHKGYDIVMPQGTPILAAASGTVVTAQDRGPTRCRGQMVPSFVLVRIDHGTKEDGNQYSTAYLHLSSLSVKVGDLVTAGQIVGMSGNTGCSTGPHLHFAVTRVRAASEGRPQPVDPYGWSGAAPDPDHKDPQVLWMDGRAPALRRGARVRAVASDGPTVVRVAAWVSGAPLEEYVDIGVAPAGKAASLAGMVVRNHAGESVPLPAVSIEPGQYVRVWTSSAAKGMDNPGMRKATDASFSRSQPLWADTGECVQLLRDGAVISALPSSPKALGCDAKIEAEVGHDDDEEEAP